MARVLQRTGVTVAIAPYSEQYWYPSGTVATGVLAYVFPRTSNVLAILYADLAGTVPLANPLPVNGGGFLSFFTESGDYWLYINGQSFYVIIDTDGALTQVWPSTYVHDHPVSETVWTVEHGLKSKPAVTVLIAGQIVTGDVLYVDDDNLTITFGAPVSGVAYLRR